MHRILSVIALFFAGITLLSSNPVFALNTNKAVPVFVSKVQQKMLGERIEALGTLRANEAVTISATVTETITAIRYEDGQRVAAGDVLVEMTSREEHAQLEEARSTLQEAKRQYNRVIELVKSGSAPESLLDQRLRERETAQARLAAIRSRLQDRLIIAPFAGVLGTRELSAGALVRPGDIITTLDDDSVMKLDFTVPALYLNSLRPGLEITATAAALGQQQFTGSVSSVNFRVNPVTRAIQVRAILPNPKQVLRPGLLMVVELFANPHMALVVPEQAVIFEADNHYLFTVEYDQQTPIAKKQKVTLGLRQPGVVEVIDGVTLDQTVVVDGAHNLQPDSALEILATSAANASLQDLLMNKPQEVSAENK